MKKVIVLAVLLLLASTIVVAGEYRAKVWNRLHWNVGDTWDAELSFERDESQPVAQDFILYVPDYECVPKKVFFEFRGVQRKSVYKYLDVLIVDNKKPYDVELSIKEVEPPIPCANRLVIKCDGTKLFDNGPTGKSVIIPAEGTVRCDFMLWTGWKSCYHDYKGVITWKAMGPAGE